MLFACAKLTAIMPSHCERWPGCYYAIAKVLGDNSDGKYPTKACFSNLMFRIGCSTNQSSISAVILQVIKSDQFVQQCTCISVWFVYIGSSASLVWKDRMDLLTYSLLSKCHMAYDYRVSKNDTDNIGLFQLCCIDVMSQIMINYSSTVFRLRLQKKYVV